LTNKRFFYLTVKI